MLIGGFGSAGQPVQLIDALRVRETHGCSPAELRARLEMDQL